MRGSIEMKNFINNEKRKFCRLLAFVLKSESEAPLGTTLPKS